MYHHAVQSHCAQPDGVAGQRKALRKSGKKVIRSDQMLIVTETSRSDGDKVILIFIHDVDNGVKVDTSVIIHISGTMLPKILNARVRVR